MADNNPDSLNLSEEDNGTPEQFNEAVSAAGRQTGAKVWAATTTDPKKATLFSQVGKIIVAQVSKN